MREIATKKKPVFVHVSCLGCQHFISDWLGKLKPNKLSTGCQNELKGATVEKATNPGRQFYFSCGFAAGARLDKIAMLHTLTNIENYVRRVMTSLLMSSPPISISHRLFRCRYSNSRDVVASSPSFSRPAARAPRRACSQAMAVAVTLTLLRS